MAAPAGVPTVLFGGSSLPAVAVLALAGRLLAELGVAGIRVTIGRPSLAGHPPRDARLAVAPGGRGPVFVAGLPVAARAVLTVGLSAAASVGRAVAAAVAALSAFRAASGPGTPWAGVAGAATPVSVRVAAIAPFVAVASRSVPAFGPVSLIPGSLAVAAPTPVSISVAVLALVVASASVSAAIPVLAPIVAVTSAPPRVTSLVRLFPSLSVVALGPTLVVRVAALVQSALVRFLPAALLPVWVCHSRIPRRGLPRNFLWRAG